MHARAQIGKDSSVGSPRLQSGEEAAARQRERKVTTWEDGAAEQAAPPEMCKRPSMFGNTWQVRVNNVPNHRLRLTREAFLGGLRPPRLPNESAAVAASAGQECPTIIALVECCGSLRRPVFGVRSKISLDQHV